MINGDPTNIPTRNCPILMNKIVTKVPRNINRNPRNIEGADCGFVGSILSVLIPFFCNFC